MSDLAARNREHFNKHATSSSNDWEPVIRVIIAELQARRAWINAGLDTTNDAQTSSIKLLDYACGAGTVSKALAPYVGEIVGLDVSDGMIEQYHKAAQTLGAQDRMTGHVYDLLGTEPAPVDLSPSQFDIIVISMALHHVADPDQLLQRFSRLLKPDGSCIVLDLITAPVSSDQEKGLNDKKVKHTVHNHGFSREEMLALYDQAGLEKAEYIPFDKPFEAKMNGKAMKMSAFIARAEKAKI